MTSSTTPTNGQTVQFATELLDIGGDYDPSTSVYTVPQTGTFRFSWTITIYKEGYYTTELVVNTAGIDSMMTNTRNSDSSYSVDETSTATTTVQLTTGDRVFIRVQIRSGSATIKSEYNGYSTFSGWLLH